MSLQWINGFSTVPAKSACGGFHVYLLASPKGHYASYHRPSLTSIVPCGPAVETIEEAKQHAETDLYNLMNDLPRYCQRVLAK